VIPFFAPPSAVRKVIYTTNAMESVNAQLCKIIKTRGHFPNDEAATKLLWLALRNITAKWRRLANHWKTAMNHKLSSLPNVLFCVSNNQSNRATATTFQTLPASHSCLPRTGVG